MQIDQGESAISGSLLDRGHSAVRSHDEAPPAMVGVPVDVPHKMGATIRALHLDDGELVAALKIRVRN